MAGKKKEVKTAKKTASAKPVKTGSKSPGKAASAKAGKSEKVKPAKAAAVAKAKKGSEPTKSGKSEKPPLGAAKKAPSVAAKTDLKKKGAGKAAEEKTEAAKGGVRAPSTEAARIPAKAEKAQASKPAKASKAPKAPLSRKRDEDDGGEDDADMFSDLGDEEIGFEAGVEEEIAALSRPPKSDAEEADEETDGEAGGEPESGPRAEPAGAEKAEKKAKKRDELKIDRTGNLEAQWKTLFEKTKGVKAAAYKMSESYEAKTPIIHKVLGWGYVLTSQNNRLEVLFKDGIKMLIANYKG